VIEPRYFNGQIEFLNKARELTDLPILAKGFLFNETHLAECAARRADSYLLMVRVLECVSQNIEEFVEFGKKLDLEAFIEANTSEAIQTALCLKPKIIEVNNRNIYRDFSLDFENVKIGKGIPGEIAFVSASGINTPKDLEELYAMSESRVDAVLVGTSIMESWNVCSKVREFVKAGKEVID